MTKLNELTIAQAADGLEKGDFSARELVDACLSASEAAQDLNAFITLTPDVARDRAEASDARRAKGSALGVLDGIPVAVKDLFCTEGVLTTAASHILDGFVPTYESTITRNLADAGAVMIGKTNLDEFAMGSSNMTSFYGPVEKPLDRRKRRQTARSPAARPAARPRRSRRAFARPGGHRNRHRAARSASRRPFCGIVGMKPTYGRCSRWGTVAFASSLDQAGPIDPHGRAMRPSCWAPWRATIPRIRPRPPMACPISEAALQGKGQGLARSAFPASTRMDGMPEEIQALWDQGASPG